MHKLSKEILEQLEEEISIKSDKELTSRLLVHFLVLSLYIGIAYFIFK